MKTIDLLASTYFERGLQHGRQLKGTIQDVVSTFKKGHPENFAAIFLEETEYMAAVAQFTPGLLDEVAGIAAGAGVTFAEAFCISLLDEVWAQHGWNAFTGGTAANVSASTPADGAGLGCTAVGIADRQLTAVAIAQTMDLEPARDGTQVLLRTAGGGGNSAAGGGMAADAEPAQLIATQAGLIGLCGGNSAWIMLVVNNLWQLSNAKHGLPVAFVVRGILRCKTWAEAVSFVEQTPHASGQAYTIAGPNGEMATWECDSQGVTRLQQRVVRRRDGRGRNGWCYTAHSNHPIAVPVLEGGDQMKAEQSAEAKVLEAAGTLAKREQNSRARQASVEAQVLEILSKRDLVTALGSLGSSGCDPICKAVKPEALWATFFSLVAVVTPGCPRLFATATPCTPGSMVEISFL
eukprot:gene1657-30862_t